MPPTGPDERRSRTGRAFRRSDGPPSRPTAPSDRKGVGLPRDEPRPKRGHGESASLGARAERLGPGTVGPGFNFAFADAGSEPSGGHADEIADLREAMGYARTTAGLDTVFVAGRGLGAWAAVAAATDELCAGAVLLGLSYTGQPERRMALERLEEFEVPTLVLVGLSRTGPTCLCCETWSRR